VMKDGVVYKHPKSDACSAQSEGSY
jgi:hypothetical protein